MYMYICTHIRENILQNRLIYSVAILSQVCFKQYGTVRRHPADKAHLKIIVGRQMPGICSSLMPMPLAKM